MTRRCCGASCACKMVAADDTLGNDIIDITGTGTSQDPFVIFFRGLSVDLTPSNIALDLDYTPDGYVLSGDFASTSVLDAIGDVDASAPSNAQVLGWDTSLGKWTPRNPTTAAAGSVDTDTSLAGDGSSGSPLGVNFAPTGGVDDAGAGVTLTDDVLNSLVRHFVDLADRALANPAPVLNSLSSLDSNPGVVDWYDGSDWQPLVRLKLVTGTEYLALSGSYGGEPVVMWSNVRIGTTDTNGSFVVIDTIDLAGYAGVLTVTITPMIAIDGSEPGWFASVDSAPIDTVTATAFAADGSGPVASSTVTCLVTAHLY